jgi:hypothetical protein
VPTPTPTPITVPRRAPVGSRRAAPSRASRCPRCAPEAAPSAGGSPARHADSRRRWLPCPDAEEQIRRSGGAHADGALRRLRMPPSPPGLAASRHSPGVPRETSPGSGRRSSAERAVRSRQPGQARGRTASTSRVGRPPSQHARGEEQSGRWGRAFRLPASCHRGRRTALGTSIPCGAVAAGRAHRQAVHTLYTLLWTASVDLGTGMSRRWTAHGQQGDARGRGGCHPRSPPQGPVDEGPGDDPGLHRPAARSHAPTGAGTRGHTGPRVSSEERPLGRDPGPPGVPLRAQLRADHR